MRERSGARKPCGSHGTFTFSILSKIKRGENENRRGDEQVEGEGKRRKEGYGKEGSLAIRLAALDRSPHVQWRHTIVLHLVEGLFDVVGDLLVDGVGRGGLHGALGEELLQRAQRLHALGRLRLDLLAQGLHFTVTHCALRRLTRVRGCGIIG